MFDWSKEQLDVINSTSQNTLVSASAGSGKTAVMVERVIKLVTQQKFSLRRIMMVTFANDVASELKVKIAKSLKQQMTNDPLQSKHIRQQIDDLPLCDISTLHAMCANFIKSNFEELELDPSFGIIDTDTSKLLFAKAVDEILMQYENDFDIQIEFLTKLFGRRENLIEKISSLYKFVVAQLDREKFLSENFFYACVGELNEKHFSNLYLHFQKQEIYTICEKLQECKRNFDNNDMVKLSEHAENYLKYFENYEKINNFEAFVSFFSREIITQNLSSKKYNDDVLNEMSKSYTKFKNEIKDKLEKWKQLADYTYAEHCEIINDQLPYLQKLSEIVSKTMQKYKEYKMLENKLDFNDLEYYAVQLLKSDVIAQQMQEKYDFICVDEYQDINAVQEFILSRVSRGNNLFMVGDSKQSIYQFRMTDPNIFINKFEEFGIDNSLGLPFMLNKNYRSSLQVVQFVNDVFDKIMKKEFGGVDYKNTSQLECGATEYFATVENPIQIVNFEKDKIDIPLDLPNDKIYSVQNHKKLLSYSACEEGFFVAQKISELVGIADLCVLDKQGKAFRRKIEYSDICILCQSRSQQVSNIVKLLQSLNIPIDSGNIVKNEKNNILSKIFDFLMVVDNPCQDFALISAMVSPIGGFSLSELAQIKSVKKSKCYFYQACEVAKDIENDLQIKVANFYALLDKYRLLCSCSLISEVIQDLIYNFKIDKYLLSQENGKIKLAQIFIFIENLKEKTFNNSLQQFLAIIEEMPNIQEVESVSFAQKDCVNTNTIHASKGLEYPIVFLVDSSKKFNHSELNDKIIMDKNFGVVLKSINTKEQTYESNAVLEMIKFLKKKENLQEAMRLFYVAITRAKNMLYISSTGSIPKAEKDIVDSSSFMEWLFAICRESENFEKKYFVQPMLEQQEANFEDYACPKFLKPDQNIIQKINDRFENRYAHTNACLLSIKHSVSSINSDSNNSVTFLTTDSDTTYGVPNPIFNQDNESSFVGTAYHKVLEHIDYDSLCLQEIENKINHLREKNILTMQQYECIEASVILQCLESHVIRKARNNKHLREKEFMLYVPACDVMDTNVTDKILLQGTIDLLILGEENILVDFKISSKSEEYLKQNYSRQLSLYAFAIESCLNVKVDKKYLYILGRNLTIEV